jgi:hypothetical protein
MDMSLKQYLFIPVILSTVVLACGQDKEPAPAGVVAPVVKSEQGENPGKPAKDEGKEESGLQATRYMPLGKPNLRVKIPQFKDGVLECLMRAGEMTRVSDDDINIKQMDIEFVGEDDAEMKIELEEATYSLKDKLISSRNRAIVRRSDFTLIGDSLDFDTENRHGRMTGKVRMVIHNSANLVKGDESGDNGNSGRQPKHVSVSDAAGLVLEAIKNSKEGKRGTTHGQQP